MATHPRRAVIHQQATVGARLADRTASVIGSWRFLIIQSGLLALWLLYNSLAFTQHFDSFPYILCNLALSFQAAFTGPVLLIAANRSAQRDRQRDDVEATEVDDLVRLLQQNTALTEQVAQLTREVHSAISGQPLMKWPAMPTPQPIETLTGRARDARTGRFIRPTRQGEPA